MKNRLFSGIGAVISGLLISLGPQTLFKACGPKENGSWMLCHWTTQAELGVGLLIAASGVLLLLFSSRKVRLGLSIATALAGILVILFPTILIGGCAMKTMTCQRLTFPVLEVIGAITVIGFAVNTWLLLIQNRAEKKGTDNAKAS